LSLNLKTRKIYSPSERKTAAETDSFLIREKKDSRRPEREREGGTEKEMITEE